MTYRITCFLSRRGCCELRQCKHNGNEDVGELHRRSVNLVWGLGVEQTTKNPRCLAVWE